MQQMLPPAVRHRQPRQPSSSWSVSTNSSKPSNARVAASTRTPDTPNIVPAVEQPSIQFISSRPSS
jgi:hypothetical protein